MAFTGKSQLGKKKKKSVEKYWKASAEMINVCLCVVRLWIIFFSFQFFYNGHMLLS